MESASSIAEQDSLSERSTLKGILELAERDGCLRWSDLWLDGSIFEAVKGLQLPQPVEGVHRVALAQHVWELSCEHEELLRMADEQAELLWDGRLRPQPLNLLAEAEIEEAEAALAESQREVLRQNGRLYELARLLCQAGSVDAEPREPRSPEIEGPEADLLQRLAALRSRKMEWGKVVVVNSTQTVGSTPIEIEVSSVPSTTYERNLAEGIKSLYQTCQMYDLDLVVGKTRLPAHKVVLASMSDAFCDHVRKAVADFQAPPAAIYGNQWKTEGGEEPHTRPELRLDIASPEAARALLDLVYGLGSEYNIDSEEANTDVLRLARQLDLPGLQALATRYLGESLSSENAVQRLRTCQEFGLQEMYEAIVDEVVMSKEALEVVARKDEVMQQPEILQRLLVRSARKHFPVPKRKRDEESKGREKMPKVSSRGGA